MEGKFNKNIYGNASVNQLILKLVFTAFIAISSIYHIAAQTIILTSQEKLWIDANNCNAAGPRGAWLSFTINNNTGSTINNVKVSFSNFTGANASLFKKPVDSVRFFSSITNGTKIPVYFYVDYSAICPTGIFAGRTANYSLVVTSSNPTVVRNGTITTDELLTASAAGMPLSSTLSHSSIYVGQTFTQTVVYGFGNNTDLFFQPNCEQNFPDNKIRLVGSKVTAVTGSVSNILNQKDSLHYPLASASGSNNTITVQYTWQSIGLNSAFTVRPWAAAKSGQKYKYEGLGASSIIPAATLGIQISKSVSPSFLATPTSDGGFGAGIVEWSVNLTNNTNVNLTVNSIRDSIVPCMTISNPFSGSSTITSSQSSSFPSIGTNGWREWVGKAQNSTNPQEYVIPANSVRSLKYLVNVSACSSPSDRNNYAIAKIGDVNTDTARAYLTIGCVNPTISYASASFDPIGNAVVSITGLTGGIFSSSPAGLSLNTSTGTINLATSTPGTYTVSYSVNNGQCIGTANTSVTVLPGADLEVIKSNNNGTPNVGSTITFTVLARNYGPSNATGVVVNDAIPNGYSVISVVPSIGTWLAPNWTIGNFSNGATATLTVTATVNASGTYANTATISGSQTDPNPSNNTSTSTPVPVPVADLKVLKSVNNATPDIGSTITFTIKATNLGPSNATGVVVNDIIPAGYNLISATPTQGTWNNPNWTIGNLAMGDTFTLSILALVNASGSYLNTATISGSQTDPNNSNNSASASTCPTPAPLTSISGNNHLCLGSNYNFTHAVSGGTWSSSNTSIITINAITGVASPVSAGTANIIYTVTNACGSKNVQKSVTIYAIPSAVITTGDPAQCLTGNSFTFNISTHAANTVYDFNFGDGNNGNTISSSINHNYSSAGTYNVTVTATNSLAGCSSNSNLMVTVYPHPVANITVNSSTQCLNQNSFTFSNQSTINSGSISGVSWNFGDATTANSTGLSSVSHTYTTVGSYNVNYTINSNNNCATTGNLPVTVLPSPTSSFTPDALTKCVPENTFNFTSSSTLADTYAWSFGDGNTSNTANTSNNYLNAGTYQVKLIVGTNAGCFDTSTTSVILGALGAVDFNYDLPICSETYNFNNQSSGAVSYVWNFGDGNQSNDFHPTHTYASTGSYDVKLVAIGTVGCKDSVTKTVTYNGMITPTALFSYTVLDCDGTLEFTNLSSNAVEYIWDFNNGFVCTSTINNVIRQFGAGTYYVSLIAKGLSANCADTFSMNITIPPKPISVFSSTPLRCTLGYRFNNFSYFGSTYTWNFGDPASGVNNTSNLVEPTHTFTANGTYIVSLTVSNGGCNDVSYDTITVDDSGISPTAAFTYTDISGACLNRIQFNNTSTNAVSYVWKFDDGSSSAELNATKTYPLAGSYDVTLIAISATGCIDSVTQTINIATDKEGSLASFTVNDSVQCEAGNRFHFYNNSVYYGNSWIPRYYWDFGDGTIDTFNTFVFNKKYATEGTYTVRLIAVSVSGCRDTAYQTVVVKPSANPTFYSGTLCTMTAQITNASTDGIAYLWNYGDDDNLYPVDSPFHTHTYSTPGWKIIKLIALAANGCHDSVTVPVYPTNGLKPEASFIFDTVACTQAIRFTSTSLGASEVRWLYGDGTPLDSTYRPIHPYAVAGVYNVMLIASNGPGCIDTTYMNVPAPAGVPGTVPTSDFEYEIAPCVNVISLINKSTDAISYQWLLNDSLIATSTNASINNAPAGVNQIKLISINGICTDTMMQYIMVEPKPIPNFNITSSACSKTIVFNSTSVYANTYSWNFGEPSSLNNTSNASMAAHTYNLNGTYFVKLVVSNQSGCSDSIIKSVAVTGNINAIRAGFNYNYNTCDCPNSNKVEFTNTSQGSALRYLWNFGDGRTSTQTNPHKGYADTGWFTVTLLAYDSAGCAATASANVYIQPTAQGVSAGFYTDIPHQCITNNSFNFYNTSVYLGNQSWINKYYWYFGDGGFDSTNSSVYSKTYSSPGIYTVTLVAVAVNGCRDTMTMNIIVEDLPCNGLSIAQNTTSPIYQFNYPSAQTNQQQTTGIEKASDLTFNWSLYPNPNDGNFTVISNYKFNGKLTAYAYDMFGKEIPLNIKYSSNQLIFQADYLSNGKYFIIIKNNEEFLSKIPLLIVR